MEYFLILIAIILLIVTLTKKSGTGDMLHEFYALSRKLDKIVNDLQDINYKLNRLEVKLNLQEKTVEPEIKPEEIIAPPIASPPSVEMPEEIMEEILPAQENEFIEEKVPIKENIPSAKANRYSTYYSTEEQEKEASKGFWEEFKEKNPDIEKFIGENLISKIGIVILVLGISFFVKYAIDKDWINESGRVGIGILSGVILLGFSNYLHKEYKAFSSILVAGAITVFYFTIGYGFHKYQLYSQSVAFGIMVVITIFSTLISVYYQRQELAVLSTIGGFAVPFMVSTGEGNYIILFTYILLLNIGMLVLSYFKNWDIVKVLSFAFTMIIYLFWFSEKYPPISPQAHDNALLFINAFYLIFLTVNIVDIIKNRPIHLGLKVAMLLLNTAITYFVSMNIMSEYHPSLRGLYTLGFSAINLGLTYMVYKRNIEQRNIIYLLLGLTLTFATLAIPVQFDGYYITLFWAGEALLLLWISYQSQQKAFFGSSIIVYLLMLISLAMDWGHYQSGLLYPIAFNSIFLTGIICNVSIYGAYWLLRRYDYELIFLEQKN